ncbi:alkene reductase [Nocardia cyriacigeorgica]|uniref:alkene reductase n=1 Tax=Nocardia cyriacigeorgica TaxID=135487 RepID=UPI003518DA9D
MLLLTEYRDQNLTLPNRVVMSPMTRLRSLPDGSPTSDVVDYYAQRASAGLIITEGIWPHSSGQSEAWVPGLQTAAHVAAWRRVTEAVHAAGGRIFAQLMHGGRKGHLLDGTKSGPIMPAAMTRAEIASAVEHFATAAANAIEAGFDGVEIHAANSYLVHQFLADNTNLRDDEYGGSIANRMRFALEVTDAVIAAVGAHRTAIRLSPGNPQFGMVEADPGPLYRPLVAELDRRGLAYLHLIDNDDYPALTDLRPLWHGTLIANVGENRDQTTGAAAERALTETGADLVSFGRAFISNPDLVERIARDLPLSPIRESHLYGRTAEGYSDYPSWDDDVRREVA